MGVIVLNKVVKQAAPAQPTKAKARKPKTSTPQAAEKAHKRKDTGFAVGLRESHYWWVTVEADARGINRTEFINQIVDQYIRDNARKR
jgi:predicted DNA binding CopG/RHH family protein